MCVQQVFDLRRAMSNLSDTKQKGSQCTAQLDRLVFNARTEKELRAAEEQEGVQNLQQRYQNTSGQISSSLYFAVTSTTYVDVVNPRLQSS